MGTKELNLAFEVLDPNLTYAAYAAPRPFSDHEWGEAPQIRRFPSHLFAPPQPKNPLQGCEVRITSPLSLPVETVGIEPTSAIAYGWFLRA
jgi:hypothetical protein